MFDLPKVYVNKINNNINNNQLESKVEDRHINIESILSNDKYVFNHKYIITLKDNEIIDSIISKSDNKILTLENKWIDINDIINISEIKK
ncbi:MAG: hypothetical protein E7159_06115 [Firmicutes bacterium]|nr:hypothetical protein [Bacillota bacterium]